MELFRNVGIRARIILTTMVVVTLAILVFGYIKYFEVQVNFQVLAFLANLFLLVALITSYLVSVSIVRPLERLRKKLAAFTEKRTANPTKDFGEDEISEMAKEIDRLFVAWNHEFGAILKKQKAQSEEKTKIALAQSDLEHQLGLAKSCLAIAQKLNTTFDFQANLKTILDAGVRAMNVQWASILLVNRETLELTVACVRGIEQSLLDDLAEDQYPAIKLKPHEGLAGQVIKSGLPLLANKGHNDPRFKAFSEFKAREEKIASLLCAPIKGSDGVVLGVVNFVNRISPPVFRNEDIPFAEDICLLVALVVERNRLFKSLFVEETTGLYTHKVWREYFQEEVNRSLRYSHPLSLAVIDIDLYKEIVEQTNHEFGLKISAEIGGAIKALLRDTDIASRAHERFYLLLVDTDAAGAMYTIGRIKESIEKLSFEHAGKKFSVTISVGIAAFPETDPNAKNLIENAQKALEAARASGRNRAVIYGSTTN